MKPSLDALLVLSSRQLLVAAGKARGNKEVDGEAEVSGDVSVEAQTLTIIDHPFDIAAPSNAGRQTGVSGRQLTDRTVAEFFSGIGLTRLALENKGWRVVFANDIDPQKYEMYRANFPRSDESFRADDVHLLPADVVPTVMLATASFPCNDLSLAGSMKGLSGKQSGAFWGFVRVLEEMGIRRPPLVMLENVVGWLNSRRGADFADCLLSLNRIGYACDAFVLNAASFVPQSRPRLFVVGKSFQMSAHCVSETPSFYQSQLRPRILADFILFHPEIIWAIRDMPTPPQRQAKLEDMIEDLPPEASEWWSLSRASYLLGQMSETHSAIAQRMIAGDRYTYGTVFRRVRHGRSMAELRTDGIAGCLRTPRGGSGRQILFKAGRGEYAVRLLTPRECARLQGVTDDYKIHVPANQALFGFGDAVCVPLIEWIVDNYLDPVVSDWSSQTATLDRGDY